MGNVKGEEVEGSTWQWQRNRSNAPAEQTIHNLVEVVVAHVFGLHGCLRSEADFATGDSTTDEYVFYIESLKDAKC